MIAIGTTLPKLCIRTARPDDLIEIEEHVRTHRSVERLVGAFGAAWSYEDGALRYWINRGELARLKRLRKIWSWVIGSMIVLIAVSFLLGVPSLMIGTFFGLCAFVASYQMLPSPLSVAAVWGGQVFLLRVPVEVVRQVLAATTQAERQDDRRDGSKA